MLKKYLAALQSECIENYNVSSQHLEHKDLHLIPKGKDRLAVNFLKQIRKLWRSVEHFHESFFLFDLSDKIDHKVLRRSENLLPKSINEENTYGIREIKYLRNENPCRVIIGHINIKTRKERSLNRLWNMSAII